MSTKSWWLVPLFIACLALAACGQAPSATTDEPKPATVEHLDGDVATRITLTEEAVEHLDLQTDTVSELVVAGKKGKAIPYSAIVYDTEGKTWAYVESEPEIFLRSPISVEAIRGGLALLSEGPEIGTAVVTVGAEELFGSETEFSEE